MIQTSTVLEVADNSGARKVACIRVLGGSRRRYASVGDLIVVSVKDAITNARVKKAAEELAAITGQKAAVRKARKSIANFKLRQGQPVGCTVTLRGVRMWEFFDRLVNVSLPRVRDFKGVSAKGFDGRGNYSLGIREQIIFPEIDYDSVENITGLNVTVVTSARNDAEGKALLAHLGMPFRP